MELVYTTSKSAKEMVKLYFARGGKRHHYGFCYWVVFSLWCMLGACLMGVWAGFAVDYGIDANCILFGLILICSLPYLHCLGEVLHFMRAYRRRKNNRIEYRLTDSEFAFVSGERRYSAPWSKVAKNFKVDKNAIYLYGGKDMPFEAKFIPNWRGRGAERKEIVAILKKAGLKAFPAYTISCFVALFLSIPMYCLYFNAGGIEWGEYDVPERGELRVEMQEVPDEDNALEALWALTNVCTLASSEDSAHSNEWNFVEDYAWSYPIAVDGKAHESNMVLRTEKESRNRARKIVDDNKAFFDGFHAAMSRKGFFDKERAAWGHALKTEDDGNGGTLYKSYEFAYSRILDFGRLVELKAQVDLENGDLEAAKSAIEDLHALGEKLSGNANTIFECKVGGYVLRMSYAKMCEAVAMGKISDEMVDRFSQILDEDFARLPEYREKAARRRLAHICAQLVEIIRDADDSDRINCQFDAVLLGEGRCGKGGSAFRFPGEFSYDLHRRKTMSRIAEIFRAATSGGELPKKELPKKSIETVARHMLPNGIGDLMISRILDYAVHMVGKCPSCGDDSGFKTAEFRRLRARLVLAAAKWRKEHNGENTPSLEALVPEYIAAVPDDPWDKAGGPVKYDAALGVVWSVGEKGDYDYRKVAKQLAENESPLSEDVKDAVSKNAFRLDAQPILFPGNADGAKAVQ